MKGWWSMLRYRARLARRAFFLQGIDRQSGRRVPVRHYGDEGTIHGTGEVNVELHNGRVVSVWFRCALLPFTQHEVDEGRAEDMRGPYRAGVPRITAIDFIERPR